MSLHSQHYPIPLVLMTTFDKAKVGGWVYTSGMDRHREGGLVRL